MRGYYTSSTVTPQSTQNKSKANVILFFIMFVLGILCFVFEMADTINSMTRPFRTKIEDTITG